MWDDIDVSATAAHGSLTISASNPTSMAAATNSREQERKTSAPVVSPPIQSKKNFLDGFKMRGNLNPRTKSDDNVSDTTCLASGSVPSSSSTTTYGSERTSSTFRNTSTSFDAAAPAAADAIVAGSITKVLVDYRPVNNDEVAVDRGDSVQVREATPHGRYLVATQSGREGWVPGYVLNLLTTGPPKKPPATGSWTFKNRFKKHQSSGNLKEDSGGPALPAVDATCTVSCGDTAVLRCRRMTSSASAVSSGAGVRWMAPNGHLLINSGRKYSFGADADTSVLYISDCDVRDGGEYTCVQPDNVESIVILHVKDRASGGPPPLPEPPKVVDLRETTAILAWEQASCLSPYTVECCRITDPNKSWNVVNRNVADAMCVVQDLTPGETYSFRVLPDGCGEPSLPSNPLTVPPLSEVIAVAVNNPLHKRNSFQDLDDCWQRDFERQYIELEELGRGRFAVVRR